MKSKTLDKIEKKRFYRRFAASLVICLLVTDVTGCARFEPIRFPRYQMNDYPHKSRANGLTFAVGQFSREEIKKYFASNLVKKNIWPVRAVIANEGKETFLFSKGMIEPQVTSSLEAARRGRRSAGHRLFWGYIFISSFFGIPIGIPLVVTGFQALDANSYMESEYKRREIADGKIGPGETLSGIVFFHRPDLPRTVGVDLIDAKTDQKINLTLDLEKIQVPVAVEEIEKEVVQGTIEEVTFVEPVVEKEKVEVLKEVSTAIMNGKRLEDGGKVDEAIQEYKRALRLDPKNLEAYIFLGQAYYRQKMVDDAITILKEAVEIHPQSTELHQMLKTVYEDKDMKYEAQKQEEIISQLTTQAAAT